ncbi:hypothetical protein UlMin_015386 [Ulmus minor]
MSTPTKLPSSSSPPAKPLTGSQPSQNSQRPFSDADEIQLLKIFRKLSESSSEQTPSSAITSPNLDRIETSLGLRFNHSEIIDKLRRLKLKYHQQARTKSLVKTPHDRRLLKIALKIWGKNIGSVQSKRSSKKEYPEAKGAGAVCSREFSRENGVNFPAQGKNRSKKENPESKGGGDDAGCLHGKFSDCSPENAVNFPVLSKNPEKKENPEGKRGETVCLDDFPVLKHEISACLPENIVWKKGLMGLGGEELKNLNEKWMMLKMEEAEIMARKVELAKEQMKLIMEASVSPKSK